ncbi:MAG: MEDS domain-containing protein [Actinomycetota bacterium]
MSDLRQTGIEQIGDVPWGTHFCQFYETKHDLAELLVPYFKAGLENNEFCIWITSYPLKKAEAKRLLRASVDNCDSYLKNGQLEILDYTEWYTKDGGFDSNRVLNGWVHKLNIALDKGFDGMRLSGNTFWLKKTDWSDFVAYEEDIEKVIKTYRMLAICTYSLDRCNASEVVDVVGNHQFAFIKRQGQWVKIETSDARRAGAQVEHLASFPQYNPNPVVELDINGYVTFTNPAAQVLWQDYIDEHGGRLLTETRPETLGALKKKDNKVLTREFVVGDAIYLLTLCLVPGLLGIRIYGVDITARQLVLRASEDQLRLLSEQVPAIIWVADKNMIITSYTGSGMNSLGVTADQRIGTNIANEEMNLPDSIRRTVLDACQQALDGKPTRYNATLDGRHWESNVSPFRNEAGEIIGIIGVSYDSTDIFERDLEISQSKQQLKDLSAKLLEAHELERKRVAGDIHDSIGQYLAAIGMRAKGAMNLLETGKSDEATKSLESLLPLIKQSVKDVRRIQADLRPSLLDELGIIATINWYLKEFRTTFPEAAVRKRISVDEAEISDILKPNIFRILQESLNNAAKHSRASRVTISLTRNKDRLVLKISDNGCGFDTQETYKNEDGSKGLGLKSMRERAELSGGKFSVRSQPGDGTTIEASWPIQ